MRFSTKTENIMSCLINEFEKYMNNIESINKERLDQILLSLYYDIIASRNLIQFFKVGK